MYKFNTYRTAKNGQKIKVGTHMYPTLREAKQAAFVFCNMKPGWRTYEFWTPDGMRTAKRYIGSYTTNKITEI